MSVCGVCGMYVKDRMVVLFAANIAHFDRNHEAGVHILISRVQVLGNCSVVPSVQKSGYEGVRCVRCHSRHFIFLFSSSLLLQRYFHTRVVSSFVIVTELIHTMLLIDFIKIFIRVRSRSHVDM